jgi:hypothetical protein
MFADTLTVTINAVAKVMTRINQDKYSSEYLLRDTLSEFRLQIRNSSYKNKVTGKSMDRHNVELVETVYAVAPAIVPTIRKAYTVFENERSDPLTASFNFNKGFAAFFSDANITKLVNGES